MDQVIRLTNISKSYKLYTSPSDKLREMLNPFGKSYHKDFWALHDVSFDINKGEIIGIVGRNGSGKSTLLKIICGVLQPTSGSAQVQGRIAALLELGAGFNMEYTGRQNVNMNGALMGFTKSQMEERIENILEFAEIGQFIDRPVKTYSSGMFTRLAFACAINVDPDILIVDEALAVGDIRFVRKCYAKIEEFKNLGKTIFFVTHAVDVVTTLCSRAIFIDGGKIIDDGEPKPVTIRYQKMMLGEEYKEPKKAVDAQPADESKTDAAVLKKEEDEMKKLARLAADRLKATQTGKQAEIMDYGILNAQGERVSALETGVKYTFFCRALLHTELNSVYFGFPIKNVKGVVLFATNTHLLGADVRSGARGEILEARLDVTMWLAPGNYFLSFRVGSTIDLYDELIDATYFVVCVNPNLVPGTYVNLNPSCHVEKKALAV